MAETDTQSYRQKNLHDFHKDGYPPLSQVTVEHTYDVCPKYSELGSFRIIAYLYVSDGSRRWQRKYSEEKSTEFLSALNK